MALQTNNIGPMIDITSALIGAIATDVAAVRVRRQLPPLVCNVQSPVFPFYLGAETVYQETAAPRVVWIPTTIETKPAWSARAFIQGNPTGLVQDQSARPFGTASSTSTSSSGATMIPRRSTHCSHSTAPSSSIERCSGRFTAIRAAHRTFRSADVSGGKKRRTPDLAGFSSSRSASAWTSRTSRTSSCRSQTRACRGPLFKWNSPSRLSGRTARAPSPALFPCPEV